MTRVRVAPTALRRESGKPTYYQTLGVPPGTAVEVIHARYRELAFRLHPDRGGNAEEFKAVALAWGTLKNAELRKVYDTKLRLERTACSVCGGRGLVGVQKGFTQRVDVECRECGGLGYV